MRAADDVELLLVVKNALPVFQAGERGNPVAKPCRTLKFKIFGSLFHLRRQFFNTRLAPVFEVLDSFVHDFFVLRGRDFPLANAHTPLYVVI